MGSAMAAEGCGPGAKQGFARKLASSDKHTREKAITLLIIWLSSQQEVGEDELKKIWKGLFYCVWHADKAAVQAELIERLAGLLESVGVDVSVSFFKVFLSTMRREWGGIDRLRLDKFYLLLRKFLCHMFKVLENEGWDQKLVIRFMGALEERAFLARDRFPALGVNLHFADVFWDEFRKFLPVPLGTLELLLEPFYSILSTSTDRALLKRVRENIFIPLLDDGRALASNVEKTDVVYDQTSGKLWRLLGPSSIAPRLFDLASSPTTIQANRKILYDLSDEFSKVAKAVGYLKGGRMNGHGPTAVKPPVAEQGPNVAEARSEDVDGGSVTRLSQRKAKAAALGVKPPFQGVKVLKAERMKTAKKGRSSGMGGRQGAAQPVEQSESGDRLPSKDTRTKEEFGRDVSAALERVQKLLSNAIEAMPRKKRKGKKKQVVHGKNVERSNGDPSASLEPDTAVVREPESNSLQNQQSASQSEGTVRTFHQSISEVTVNMEKTFECLAADQRSSAGGALASPVSALVTRSTGKRKRPKGEVLIASDSGPVPASQPQLLVDEGCATDAVKKAKKVRFALRQNLICKPHAPLPPLSVRTPPSATPRGSALKSGVQPGPIRTRPLRVARGTGLGKARKRASKQHLTISMQRLKRSTTKLKGRRKP